MLRGLYIGSCTSLGSRSLNASVRATELDSRLDKDQTKIALEQNGLSAKAVARGGVEPPTFRFQELG